ncbi:MAG: oxidoreductase [Chitinophagales bacterium]
MKEKTAIIVGATGLTGSHCLQYLLANNHYTKVIKLTRRDVNMQHEKLEQQIINFDKLVDYKKLIKADDIFCCLGTTIKKAGSKEAFRKVDFEYPYQVGKIALENGAKRMFIVTALGADDKSFVFYNKVKGEIENVMAELPFEALHIFRPSLLLGDRKEHRRGESIATSLYSIIEKIMLGPLAKYKGIEAKTVAKVMVEVATKNEQGIFVYESQKIQQIFDKQMSI